MIKTVGKREIIESLDPLDLVLLFIQRTVRITDGDLMRIRNLLGAIEYQEFVTAVRDFEERVTKYNDTNKHTVNG